MQIELLPLVIAAAFFCELVDSTLGMGYGTTLTPILLLAGYAPADVVPAILLSEFVTGVLAGIFHHEFGNVDFRPGSRDFKVMLVMAVLSVIGVLVAVVVALNVPAWVLKLYVGLLVLSIGLTILRNHNHETTFSWKRIGGLGLLAAFNKGMSGGGYGPVVTGGQVLSGINGRSAIGIASLAEGLTSAVGFGAFMLGGEMFPWTLAPSLLLGAVLSTPLAAYVVSRVETKRLALAIGSFSTVLGSYTLIKLVL
ncbi:MAG: sulfite exporter TauE/SafE family protein [Anaerolineae bacterium]